MSRFNFFDSQVRFPVILTPFFPQQWWNIQFWKKIQQISEKKWSQKQSTETCKDVSLRLILKDYSGNRHSNHLLFCWSWLGLQKREGNRKSGLWLWKRDWENPAHLYWDWRKFHAELVGFFYCVFEFFWFA